MDEEGHAIPCRQRCRHFRKPFRHQPDQPMLPFQALEIDWRMLDMQDNWGRALQQEDVIGIAAGQPWRFARNIQPVPLLDDA